MSRIVISNLDWKHASKTGKRPSRKVEIMRAAKTAAEARYGMGGLEKKGAHAPRKPSMPVLPPFKEEL